MPAAIDLPNAVDLAFLAIMLLACLAGSLRGASGEIARLLSLVAGVAAAVFLNNFLQSSLGATQALAAPCALLGGVAALLLVNRLARKGVRLIVGQPADSILGAAMAAAGAFLVFIAALCAVHLVASERINKEILTESFAGRLAAPVAERINARAR
jgi:uncharacterized membrane protein required for colicin V production